MYLLSAWTNLVNIWPSRMRMKGQAMNSVMRHQPWSPVWKRRTICLTLIAALAIVCLAAIPAAQSGQAGMAGGEARLQGSWLVTVTIAKPDGPPPFEALQTYTDGGQVIGSQTSSPGWLWTPWHGAWTKTGRREFVETCVGFTYSASDPTNVYKVILRNTLVIEPDGDTYNTTSSTQEWFGPNGYYEAPVDRGDKAHGVRIHAE